MEKGHSEGQLLLFPQRSAQGREKSIRPSLSSDTHLEPPALWTLWAFTAGIWCCMQGKHLLPAGLCSSSAFLMQVFSSPFLLSSDALGWVSIDFRGSTLNACDNPPSILVCVCVFLFHVMYLYIVLCIWVMNRWHARNLYFWDTFSQILAGSQITMEGGRIEGKEVESSYLGKGGDIRQIIAKIEFCVSLLEQLWEPGESQPLSSLVVLLPLSNLSKSEKVAVTRYPEELGTHRTSPSWIHIKFATMPKAYSLASKWDVKFGYFHLGARGHVCVWKKWKRNLCILVSKSFERGKSPVLINAMVFF